MRDTIAAIATAPGRAALAIIRVSGPAVEDIATRVLRGTLRLKPRYAHRAEIVDADDALIDDGIALYFKIPASATGEDVLELHTHGSPIVAESVLQAVIAAGARLAEPGEFTKRAFLAGKLDLSAAEAVADLIDAEHRSAARAAAGRLAGGVATEIQALRTTLQTMLEEIAAAIDFPDEVEEPPRDDVASRLASMRDALAAVIAGGSYGRMVREGATIAIVGPPNAGKSSLLNALLGEERAIVSPTAGTTRDTIEEQIDCGGIMLRLIDTAGLRESGDSIERAGIKRSRKVLQEARLLIVVLDGSQALHDEARSVLNDTADYKRVILLNKRDVGTAVTAGDIFEDSESSSALVEGSVHVAATVDTLLATIRMQLVGATADLERPYLARAREISAAIEALVSIDFASEVLMLNEPLDLLTNDLVAALSALGKITGDTVTEDVLTGIFARFCIGK